MPQAMLVKWHIVNKHAREWWSIGKEYETMTSGIDYNDEAKYAFMHRHGGAGSWFFVPYIFCMSTVPKQILNKLEKQEISLYLMHLSKEQRHRRKRMINFR